MEPSMEMVRVQCSLWELPHLDLLFRMQWAMAAGFPAYPRTCSTVPLAACRSRVPRTVLSWGKACSWRNACSLGYSEGYEPAGTFSLFFCFLNYQRKVLISIPPVPKEGGRETRQAFLDTHLTFNAVTRQVHWDDLCKATTRWRAGEANCHWGWS